jgi:hypothetical protein
MHRKHAAAAVDRGLDAEGRARREQCRNVIAVIDGRHRLAAVSSVHDFGPRSRHFCHGRPAPAGHR